MIKNLLASAGDMGCDPWSGKISRAVRQLSPHTTTTKPVLESHAPQQEKPLHEEPKHPSEEQPQLASMRESPCKVTKTHHSQQFVNN